MNNNEELIPLSFSPQFHDYSDTFVKLSMDRIIFLNENITKQSASTLSALLLHYDSQDPEEMITIYIHSSGGDASGLSNIYDVMQMISAPIQTVCIGKCYSAAAVILAAGTPGERTAFKHSKIMIHGIQAGYPIPGDDLTNSKNYYEFLKTHNDKIMKILADHTGHSLKKVKEDCKEDVWMDAKTALNYNLIDYIL